MKRYEGKKVVIIGGTSGKGLATAKMLLDGGTRIVVTGRSKEGLESSQKELGNDAIVVSSDARSLTDLDALASRVKAEFDTIDQLSTPGSAPERLWRASPRPSTTRCST
jgi:NADP-dependent 3-hydroxy acid dehydrogenase YdfG